MLLVLMAIMIVSSLSILLLGTLIAQTKPIPLQRKTEMTVNAAQAGFDAALSQIRAAKTVITGVNATGDSTKLPCYWTSGQTSGGPSFLTGTVSGTGGTATYKTWITYYTQDPSNQLAVWRNDPTNQIPCGVVGPGAYTTPSYALIVSTGSDGSGNPSGNRTLTTTYKFSTDNTNVSGGPIHLAGVTPAAQTICWDAGTTIPTYTNPTPPSPWNLTLQNCASGAPGQTFQYRRNYSIVLGATSTTNTDGYCLTAPANSGQPMTMALCDPTNAAGLLARQQWGVDGTDRFYATFGGKNYTIDSILGGSSSLNVGAVLTLSTNGKTWTPNSAVGPGNGGEPIGEMANYALFGNCFDVSNWDLTYPFMILYPCKQPTPASGDQPDANQVIQYDPANKWLYVNATWKSGSPKYCFVAPATAGAYVLPTTPCSTTAPNQKWIKGDLARYSTAFTYVSVSSGQCLAAGPYALIGTLGWPTVVTNPCNGDATQKWNADPNLVLASQDNTLETADGQ
jgi:hypothetical protein